MNKLDTIDYKILYELDLNARIPISRLAKKLRISRDVANYRLKKLEQDVIRKYHAVIDVSKLGYKMYRVYFKFFSINSKDYNDLINELVKNDSVFWVGEADGMIDLSFGIWTIDDNGFSVFYKKIIKKYRKFIKKDIVNIVLKYDYLDRSYLIKNKKQFRDEKMIGGYDKVDFDKKDIEILGILSKNARESIVNIANKLKMDSSGVIYRIRNLEKKKIIAGYKADINFHIIKRYLYSVKFYLNNFDKEKELIAYLKTQPIVTNFTEAVGSFDVEVDLEVGSEQEYFDFIKDIKDRFEFISEILFFRTHKNYKIIDMPNV